MAAIKQDVREMQARGYYGDGFWSDGKRLKDGARLGAEGLSELRTEPCLRRTI